MNKRYVIISKFRFMLFIFFLIFLINFIISLILPSQLVYGNIQKTSYSKVHISKGDTLWDIAKEHNSKNYDLRKVVYDIEFINGISNADIHPGDIIKIPLYWFT